MKKIKIKRIYDEPSSNDGYRILVDRLWPRGISKEKAAIDEWNKDLAPLLNCVNGFIMPLSYLIYSKKNIETNYRSKQLPLNT